MLPRHDFSSHSPSPFDDDTLAVATIFANQSVWLTRLATGSTSPLSPSQNSMHVWHEHGLSAARTGNSGVLLAPRDDADSLSSATIDHGLDWLARHGSSDLLAWSPAVNPYLDCALLARGAVDSFAPHWMWIDLEQPLPMVPSSSRIIHSLATIDDLAAILAHPGIPYVEQQQLQIMLTLATDSANEGAGDVTIVTTREMSLLRSPRIIGLAAVNLIDTPHGRIAGLFNLGVHPSMRRQGIGTMLTHQALTIARDLGATAMGLNATGDGERIYRKLGFRSIGHGQTWFMTAGRLRNRPDHEMIQQAEAIAHGDLASLDPEIARVGLLPNGESPVVFAARFGQTRIARWLIEHGAQPDIVALWKLGLREDAELLMRDDRHLNRIAGPNATSPLHDAIDLGDSDLARHLIAAGADLTIRDSQYHATPADWARVLNRRDIAALLR